VRRKDQADAIRDARARELSLDLASDVQELAVVFGVNDEVSEHDS
jgi:hypothetical protein